MFYTISIFGEILELIHDPTNGPGSRHGNRPSSGGWGSLVAVPLMLLSMNALCFVMVYGSIFAQYLSLN